MIVDDFGHLVWFNAIGNRELATDFRVQSYRGKPVLTWWQGRLIGGEGRGEGVIYDTSYRPVRRVRAGNGLSADRHEFELTPRGTALLLIYDAVRRDLRARRRPPPRRRRPSGRAGDRPRHGPRALRVAQSRQHRTFRIAPSTVPKHNGEVGLRARQLGRARRLRRLHRLRPSHLVRAADLACDTGGSCGGSAARARTSAWARATRFAKQHDARPQADGTLTLLRQQRAAAAARGVARDHAAARRASARRPRSCRRSSTRTTCSPRPRAARSGCPAAGVRRLGLASVLHRVRRRRTCRARRALRRRRRQLPRLQVPVERAGRHDRRRSSRRGAGTASPRA